MVLSSDQLDLFSRQHGVASDQQLRALGLSTYRVRNLIATGTLRRVMPQVLGLHGHRRGLESRVMALQLAARGTGFASGRTAGRLHGLRQMLGGPVEYCTPRQVSFRTPQWARLHRTRWPDLEPRPTRRDGLIVASPPRTLLELSTQVSPKAFRRAAEDAWHLGLVTPSEMAAYLDRIRGSGRRGIGAVEAWLRDACAHAAPAQSGLEQFLADLCDEAGLPEPVRQHPVQLLNGSVIRLDLAWPDLRLAIEPGHSWWHGGDHRQRADQDRDRSLAEIGWLNLRFDETVERRRAEAVDQIARIHHARSAFLGDRPAFSAEGPAGPP